MPTEKISGVYAIINTIDNKAYIGSSTNIPKRWREHRRALQRGTHENPHLQSAYSKHGADAFDYRILEVVDDTTALAAAEWRWIVQWNTLARAHGYNLRSETQSPLHAPESRQKMNDTQKRRAPASPETRAKISAAGKGRPVSPETRAKISEALKIRLATPEAHQKRSAVQKQRFASPEARQKMSDSGKASRASPEVRKKMSDTLKKHLESPEARKKRSDGLKQRYASPEARQKLSDALKGHIVSPETRQKLRDAHTGRKLSPETRQRMSDAKKGRTRR